MGSAWTDARTYFLVRTDKFGDTLWTKTYYEDGDVDYNSYDLSLGVDGGCVVLGRRLDNNYQMFFRKIDDAGNIVWTYVDSSNTS